MLCDTHFRYTLPMSGATRFIPGLELNRAFYTEEVRPLIEGRFPGLVHAAALIGYGSDVLGTDTPVSMDHNWGPRTQLFLPEAESGRIPELSELLSWHLPATFRGFPVNFTAPGDDHTQRMDAKKNPPWRLLVTFQTVESHFGRYLNPDPQAWFGFTDQQLLEYTSGEVFHDGWGDLTAARAALARWPRDHRLLRLAALWDTIRNEEPFLGRFRDLDDPIGLRLTAARLAGTLIKICFLVENRYIPYGKWLGTVARRLECWPATGPLMLDLLTENDPARMEKRYLAAAERVLEEQNRAGDLPPVLLRPGTFYGRPYRVLRTEKIVTALKEAMTDPEIRKMSLNTAALDLKLDGCDLT